MEQKNIQVEVQGKNVLPTPIKNLRELTAEVTQAGADATEAKELAEVNTEIVADKDYDIAKFSGLGRVNLQKNIVDGHNYLTQEMVSKPNTIYKIQYDYEIAPVTNSSVARLDQSAVIATFTYKYAIVEANVGDTITINPSLGDAIVYMENGVWTASDIDAHSPSIVVTESMTKVSVGSRTKSLQEVVNYSRTVRSITVPKNCVLEFEGGSLSNGNIVFQNTLITGTYKFNNITSFVGTLCNRTLDANYISFVSDTAELYYLLKIGNIQELILKSNHIYNIDSQSLNDTYTDPISGNIIKGFVINVNRNNLHVIGDNIKVKDAAICDYFIENDKDFRIFSFISCNNITVEGISYEASGTKIDKEIGGLIKSPYGIRVFYFNKCKTSSVVKCKAKNAASGISYYYGLTDIDTNSTFEIETSNVAYSIILGNGAININAYVTTVGYHHRCVWIPSAKNVNIVADLIDSEFTATSFCFGDYNYNEGDSYKSNINIDCVVRGSLIAPVGLVIFGRRDTGDFKQFTSVFNIDVKIVFYSNYTGIVYSDQLPQELYGSNINLNINLSYLNDEVDSVLTPMLMSGYAEGKQSDRYYNIKASFSRINTGRFLCIFKDFDKRSYLDITSTHEVLLNLTHNNKNKVAGDVPTFNIHAPSVSFTQGDTKAYLCNLYTSALINRVQGLNTVKQTSSEFITNLNPSDWTKKAAGNTLVNATENVLFVATYFNNFGFNEIVNVIIHNTSESNIFARFIGFDTIPGNPRISLRPDEYYFVQMGNINGITVVINNCCYSGNGDEYPSNARFGDCYFDTAVLTLNHFNGNRWVEYDGAISRVKRYGTFADKPAASNIYIGFKYFCTDKQTTEGATNGIELIHKGNGVWVDALGRVVS